MASKCYRFEANFALREKKSEREWTRRNPNDNAAVMPCTCNFFVLLEYSWIYGLTNTQNGWTNSLRSSNRKRLKKAIMNIHEFHSIKKMDHYWNEPTWWHKRAHRTYTRTNIKSNIWKAVSRAQKKNISQYFVAQY